MRLVIIFGFASFSNKFCSYLLLIILFLSIFMNVAKCQDAEGGDEEEEPERTCQQYIFGLVRQLLPAVPKCISGSNRLNLRFRSMMEPLTRAYCIVKCLLSELEVLDETGVLDEVNALFFFQDNIPPHVLPAVVEVAGPCLEMASTLIPSQYYCQSYGPFTQCLVGALVKGLGPWILDCFGTPAFAGIFGMLQFFVPPIPPAAPGSERRIMYSPSANTTLLLQKMKTLRKQRHQINLSSSVDRNKNNDLVENFNLPNPTTVTPSTTILTNKNITKDKISNAYYDYYNVSRNNDMNYLN